MVSFCCCLTLFYCIRHNRVLDEHSGKLFNTVSYRLSRVTKFAGSWQCISPPVVCFQSSSPTTVLLSLIGCLCIERSSSSGGSPTPQRSAVRIILESNISHWTPDASCECLLAASAPRDIGAVTCEPSVARNVLWEIVAWEISVVCS